MSTVYIVYGYTLYQSNDTLGVFDSSEKAHASLGALAIEFAGESYESFLIKEMTLNKPLIENDLTSVEWILNYLV